MYAIRSYYDFAPRTDFQYSCLNYITLQRIIETISGQTLQQFAKDRITSYNVCYTKLLRAQNGSTPGGTINANHIEPVRLMTHDTVNLMLIEYIGEPSGWTLNILV